MNTELMLRQTKMAAALTDKARLLTPDPVEQVGALLTAAAIEIERRVGHEEAHVFLLAMLNPIITAWAAPTAADTVQ
ncbi:hypothetical protein M9978_16500 [Sphingomonas sp. MG17]|uniref:Uncharacterized protein n=1 Tax=Sphingomonas tagetis TaxID=2949092 RepID=A0A9X2KMT4_9SPHN|nr:hypothetical protein [Sphingomonas tagetis]MCP3732027.1 hypothetical protein [Sphingomonas tagetis]